MPSDGIYVICNGGITMKSNGTLNLPAGNTVVQGGGLDWENGTVNGTGVTIYNTGPNAGSIKVNGNMGVNLTAPTSGYYWGVVLFQDRTLTSPPAATLNGGATMGFQGAIYLPGNRRNLYRRQHFLCDGADRRYDYVHGNFVLWHRYQRCGHGAGAALYGAPGIRPANFR